MPIFPVTGAAGAIAAGAAASTAISTASAAFSRLFEAIAPDGAEGSGSPAPSGSGAGNGAELLQQLGGGKARPAGAVPTDLREQTAGLLERFHRLLTRLMGENGIDPAGGFALGQDATGNVRVAGDHPEAARIESLFAEHSRLGGLFDAIAAHSGLLKALGGAGDAPPDERFGPRSISDSAQIVVGPDRATLAE